MDHKSETKKVTEIFRKQVQWVQQVRQHMMKYDLGEQNGGGEGGGERRSGSRKEF